MKLKISWEEFSKQIDNYITEGKEIKLTESNVNNIEELEKLKADIQNFNSRCFSFLKLSFDNDNNEYNDYAMSFHNARPVRFNIGNQQKQFNQLKKETLEDLNEKLLTLPYFKKILSISDAIIKPEIVEEQNRTNYTTEQTLELILEKLYDLYDNLHHSVSTILEGNGITLKRHGEDRELLKTLENLGYVHVIHTRDASAQLTLSGKMYIEEKRKAYKENYDDIVADKEEINKRIDEIINQLSKLGFGQEIIFDELHELKEFYTTLNKKNWGQLVKGKLLDLAVSKLVENDTISYIYEALTEHKLRLP